MIDLYPAAAWIPAHPSNFHKGPRTSFDFLVVHCTDGHGDARATARMWQEDNSAAERARHRTSAHFVIGQDAMVVQCVRLSAIAQHAHDANGRSVALEHCARTPRELGREDLGLLPSPDQLRASAKLAAWLLRMQGLQPNATTIRGHAECDPKTTHDRCPEGSGLILDAYRGLVSAVYAIGY